MSEPNPITKIFFTESREWVTRIWAVLSYENLGHNFTCFAAVRIHSRVISIRSNMQILSRQSCGKGVPGQGTVIVLSIIVT